MRFLLFLGIVLISTDVSAQEVTGNIFQETFDDMFTIHDYQDVVYTPQEQGNPGVPLDGGLTALLVAGGAVGYRKYRARSKKN